MSSEWSQEPSMNEVEFKCRLFHNVFIRDQQIKGKAKQSVNINRLQLYQRREQIHLQRNEETHEN